MNERDAPRSGRPRPNARSRGVVPWILAAAVSAALALAGAVIALQLWHGDLGRPLRYTEDALLHGAFVKTVVEHGWFLDNPHLNAPFGQHLHDYAQGGDNLNYLSLRALALVSSDWAAVMNLFFLLTFPLIAATACLVLIRLGVSPLIAVLGAVLFATLAYHFRRGEGHLFLSAYYAVPLACWLALEVLRGWRPLARLRNEQSRLAQAAFAALFLGVVIVIGSTGSYYAVFSLLLLATATVLVAARSRSLRAAVDGAALSLGVGAVLVLNLLPTLLYRAGNGPNIDLPARNVRENVAFGLQVGQLFVPLEGHRLDQLDALGQRFRSLPLPGEASGYLGVLGVVGVLILGWVVMGALLGGWARGRAWRRHRDMSALVTVALLVATQGGLSVIVALTVTPQFRAWNRIVVFIAFFALLSVCLVADRVRTRVPATRLGRSAAAVAVTLALVGGVAEQTSARTVPPYAETAPEFATDQAFVRELEEVMPAGTAVYQLPYLSYPEGGRRERMGDYAHYKGYLHSRSLRWSYGGVKGREAGWQLFVDTERIERALPVIAAAGFEGLWIDRAGYADEGQAIEASVAMVTGGSPLASGDGRIAFYDLRAYRDRLRRQVGEDAFAAAEHVARSPASIQPHAGLTPVGRVFGRPVRNAGASASLRIVNPDAATPRAVTVAFALQTDVPLGHTIKVTWPDGALEEYSAGRGPLHVTRDLVVPPGTSVITFATDAPVIEPSDIGDVRFRLGDVRLLDAALGVVAASAAASVTPGAGPGT